MRKYEMMYERGGRRTSKRKSVKTTKKRSAVSRQLRATKRQAMNILGGIGIVAVVVWMFQFIISGGG